MKSKLLLALLLLTLQTFAQKSTSPQTRSKTVNGYTIKTIRNNDGTFGYVIYNGKERFVKQLKNPFTGSHQGLRNKDDAFRTAEWLIKNIIDKPGALSPSNREFTMQRLRQQLPQSLASRLKINVK